MAHFRGTVEGNRGEASRLGSRDSGLLVIGNGWEIGVHCYCHYSEERQADVISIRLTRGSNSRGPGKCLGSWVLTGDNFQRIG